MKDFISRSTQNKLNKNGYVFITLFVGNREKVFGEIHNGEMIINELGKIVEVEWQNIFENRNDLSIDEYIILPNRFYGIVQVCESAGLFQSKIPRVIAEFKSRSSQLIHESGLEHFEWQKSFMEKKIKDEGELNKIREYIFYSPMNMEE